MENYAVSLTKFETLGLDTEASKQIKGGCPPEEFIKVKDKDKK